MGWFEIPIIYNLIPSKEETKLVKNQIPTQTSIGNLGEPNLLGRGGQAPILVPELT